MNTLPKTPTLPTLDAAEARRTMDRLGSARCPFVFLVDYAMRRCIVAPIETVDPQQLLYAIGGRTNVPPVPVPPLTEGVQWEPRFCTQEEYDAGFTTVMHHLRAGNSYLVNLTCATPVRCNLTLREVFDHTEARYKVWLADHFVCFSPETFVRIDAGGVISTHPMKGTIDATLPDAERRILEDPKEAAEHATIVDLLRNDLNRIADGVHVERYRYIDRLTTHRGELLQVSSEISGQLPADWHCRIGELLFEMLPAGSVTGAPKPRTLEIIARAERYDRDYYTGICGLFDGRTLDSGVMIRFLEQVPGAPRNEYLFKSGGGITFRSDAVSEYEEMKAKVYVPLRRNHPNR